jgi:hypothetical protein
MVLWSIHARAAVVEVEAELAVAGAAETGPRMASRIITEIDQDL